MTDSRITYPETDGTTATWAFNFDVISPEHIRVEIDGLVYPQVGLAAGLNSWAPDSLSTPTAVVFDTAPTAGQELTIYRETDRSEIFKTFTNEPLNAGDLNNSFKKLLFIEQEGYDLIAEVKESIAGGSTGGAIPAPTPEQGDDHFIVTESENWVIKSAAETKEILGFGEDDTLTVTDILATSVSALNLSGVSGVFSTLAVDNLSGSITIYDDDQDYSFLRSDNANPLVFDAPSVVLKVGGEEKFRVGDPIGGRDGILHNYGDSLPATITASQNIGIALSGTGKIIAANSLKGWGTVSATATTPVLSYDTFGVSAVTKNSTGNYTIVLDSDVLAFSTTYIVIPYIYLAESGSVAFRTIGIDSRSTSSIDFQSYDNRVGSSPVDGDFQFHIY